MSRTFTYAKTYTAGLMAFGVNGATNHFASRAEIRDALQVAQDSPTGHAVCGGITLPEDNLKTLLTALGTDAA